MSQEYKTQIDYDRELERIDEAIVICKRDFEDLIYKRHLYIARKFGIDVLQLLDYVTKNYDVPQEAADIIAAIAIRKKGQL